MALPATDLRIAFAAAVSGIATVEAAASGITAGRSASFTTISAAISTAISAAISTAGSAAATISATAFAAYLCAAIASAASAEIAPLSTAARHFSWCAFAGRSFGRNNIDEVPGNVGRVSVRVLGLMKILKRRRYVSA
jgi:hypothetical protein